MLNQKGDSRVDGHERLAQIDINQVVVIQYENEIIRNGGNFIEQAGKQRFAMRLR